LQQNKKVVKHGKNRQDCILTYLYPVRLTEVDIVEAENKTERKRLSLVEKTALSGRENGFVW